MTNAPAAQTRTMMKSKAPKESKMGRLKKTRPNRTGTAARKSARATGVSGVDLYARDDQGKWKWVQVTRPAAKT